MRQIPNILTTLRVVVIPIIIIILLKEYFLISGVLFILASITDALDGHLARKFNVVSNFGKIMDPLADKLVTYSVMLCLLTIDHYMSIWIIIVFLTRDFLVEALRILAASNGEVLAAGMSGKIKTVLQMVSLVFILIFSGIDVLENYVVYGFILLIISCVVSVISGIEYFVKNRWVFKK